MTQIPLRTASPLKAQAQQQQQQTGASSPEIQAPQLPQQTSAMKRHSAMSASDGSEPGTTPISRGSTTFTGQKRARVAIDDKTTIIPISAATAPLPSQSASAASAASVSSSLSSPRTLTEASASASDRHRTPLGWSPLNVASIRGNLEVVKLLLENGADIEDGNSQTGASPLQHAAGAGQIQVVKLLLDHGADINSSCTSGATALHYACGKGHVDVVRVLAARGASLTAAETRGTTPLHVAACHGQVEVIRLLVTEYGVDVSIQARSERASNLITPLHGASFANRVEAAEVLLSLGADVNAKDTEGWTPLCLAADKGHSDLARLLLDHGALFTLDHVKTSKGSSPLVAACLGGSAEIVEMLFSRGLDLAPEKAEYEGPSFIVDAETGGRQAIVVVVVHELHPILSACTAGSTGIIEQLLSKGMSLDVVDPRGWHPLHCAAMNGQLGVVRLLLDRGVDAHPIMKLPPVQFDKHEEEEEEEDDDDDDDDDEKKDSQADRDDGCTPLMLAAMRGHAEVVRILLDQPGMKLEAASTNTGATALIHAAEYGSVETVKMLLDKGAKLNTQDKEHWTPLTAAVLGKHTLVVKVLLEHGADSFLPDVLGRTPLFIASEKGSADIVRMLLEYERGR